MTELESRTAPQGLHHCGGFYGDEEDLVHQIIPLVHDALERGDAIALALRPLTEQTLRKELGELPPVTRLESPDGAAGASGQTLATRRTRQLERLSESFGSITAITEHDARFDGPDGRFWTELDAAASLSLAPLPLRLTCFYPELAPHESIVDGALRNHPTLLCGGRLNDNAEYLPPRDVMEWLPAPAPELLGPPDAQLEFAARELAAVRALVERTMADHPYTADQLNDGLLAVNEVATNALEHGRGPAQLRIWSNYAGCVLEVHDHGVLADPLPGMRTPTLRQSRGWGLWMARQSCDYLHVWRDDDGTCVRMHIMA